MNEETLDPKNWDTLKHLAHRMVDDMISDLQTIRERPTWHRLPKEVKDKFNQSVPVEPQSAEQVYQEFRHCVRPFMKGNLHPRFWGWVEGTGTPFGMLAEMLAAGLNPNVNFGEQSPVYVEMQVLNWCKEIMGYPTDASGLIVGGCSEANLIGLAIARYVKAGFEVARDGLQLAPKRLVMYGSTETHNSIEKAVELLGLGSNSLRKIPVRSDFKIDTRLLGRAIAHDRESGNQPFCVVGNAGTVNSGAIDDLESLADICQREGLWFHIDGAFGALAALAPKLRPLLIGLERADSIAFDFHKSLSVPYDAGCILTRHADKHRQVFSTSGAYLARVTRGVAAGPIWFGEYGIQLSRGFRALKVWMMLKEHGTVKYGRLIQQNVEQAQYLGLQVTGSNGELQLLAPLSLNIVCFRYFDRKLNDKKLNALNEEILVQLQESGIAVLSSTVLDGKYALRVAITNHRSRRTDFDLLLKEVVSLGRKIKTNLVSKIAVSGSGNNPM